MSNESLKHIFDESTCLTRRQMKDYVTGSMTNEEAHAVEVHLSSCPMCNDAVDGMFAVEEGNALTVMSELNTDFLKDHFGLSNPQIHLNSLAPAADAAHAHSYHTRRKKKRVVPLWRNVSIAAALLLFIGIGWYMKYGNTALDTTNPVIAKNENPLTEQPVLQQETQAEVTAGQAKDMVTSGSSLQQTSGDISKKETQSAGEAEMSVLAAAKAKPLAKADEAKIVKHVELDAPMIDKFSPGTTQTIKADEIEKMPSRDIETIAASAPKAAYSNDVRDFNKNRSVETKPGPQMSNNFENSKPAEDLKIAGAKNEGTTYIIDGVQVSGSKGADLSKNKKKQNTDIQTSGVRGTYGSADGGVVNTKDNIEKAKAYYTLNKYTDALAIYKAEMNTGNKTHQQEAAIGAARCYMALGSKAKAKEILQSIIDEGGSQKREAKRLMKEVE